MTTSLREVPAKAHFPTLVQPLGICTLVKEVPQKEPLLTTLPEYSR
jgi:hypothetical protein